MTHGVRIVCLCSIVLAWACDLAVAFNPDGSDHSFEVACGARPFAHTLPARSIATFLWSDVTP